jgi:DNA-binding MarR family transcriptional regulator
MKEPRPEGDDFVRTTTAVRRLFHRLATEWNELHRDLGVSSRMRAMLEHLHATPSTVPAIARAKEVSRQHVQVIVNELLEAGLVSKQANPAHARSDLIALTRKGEGVFRKVTEREARLLPELHRELRGLSLSATADTLESLIDFFDSSRWRSLAKKYNRRLKDRPDERS